MPFNLVSLRAAFPPEKARALAEKLVSAYGMEKKVTILELRQNPDPELSALADYVYGHVFVRYTMKQWGQTPEEIDPNTTARVPVFLSEDCRYFQDAYQGMPLEGYTPMFQSLLDHPDITVELGVDAASRLTLDGSAALLDGGPSPAPSSIPARRTSCSAANTAACPTAPWTSALRPTRWTSGRATER